MSIFYISWRTDVESQGLSTLLASISCETDIESLP